MLMLVLIIINLTTININGNKEFEENSPEWIMIQNAFRVISSNQYARIKASIQGQTQICKILTYLDNAVSAYARFFCIIGMYYSQFIAIRFYYNGSHKKWMISYTILSY